MIDNAIRDEVDSALPYTNRIVNETLRMYPPVWFITLRAVPSQRQHAE